MFGGFDGTTGPSDFPRSCIEGLPPQRSPRDPTERRYATPRTIQDGGSPTPAGDRGISLFSRMETPCVPGFTDRAGSLGGSRITPSRAWPSAWCDSVGTPNSHISRLNSPAHTYPETNPSPVSSRTRTHGRGHRGSLALRCRALSSPSPRRFIQADHTTCTNGALATRLAVQASVGPGSALSEVVLFALTQLLSRARLMLGRRERAR